jgi:hypothetical protein
MKIKGLWQPPHYKVFEKPEEYKRALKVVVESLEEANMPYMVYAGVLLGWQRQGEMIPWDNDIDLAVRSTDTDKFEDAVENMRRKGFQINPYFGGQDKIVTFDDGPHRLGPLVRKDSCRIKVIEAGREIIINSGYRSCYFKPFDIKVEINVFYKVGNNYYWFIEDPTTPKITTWTLPETYIDNTTSFNYDNKVYSIPSQPEKVMELCYGPDWRTPRQTDFATHMYEDWNGRILK